MHVPERGRRAFVLIWVVRCTFYLYNLHENELAPLPESISQIESHIDHSPPNQHDSWDNWSMFKNSRWRLKVYAV